MTGATSRDSIARIETTAWEGPVDPAFAALAVTALENDRVLFAPHQPFELTEFEKQFLSPDCLDAKSKNVSYRPATREVQGTRLEGADRTRMLEMLERFHRYARAWVSSLCPKYGDFLVDGFSSYRPASIAERVTSWRKDDTRLHVDAFPSRPLQGRRILRVFANVSAHAPRVWRVGEEFERVAQRFLGTIGAPLPFTGTLLQLLKIVKGRRTPYDHYMLHLHDGMKADSEYQSHSPQTELALPPGSAWACYTDSVPHAAMSGQFAFEQTFYIPVEGMQNPERSPLRILERLTGRPLV